MEKGSLYYPLEMRWGLIKNELTTDLGQATAMGTLASVEARS